MRWMDMNELRTQGHLPRPDTNGGNCTYVVHKFTCPQVLYMLLARVRDHKFMYSHPRSCG